MYASMRARLTVSDIRPQAAYMVLMHTDMGNTDKMLMNDSVFAQYQSRFDLGVGVCSKPLAEPDQSFRPRTSWSSSDQFGVTTCGGIGRHLTPASLSDR